MGTKMAPAYANLFMGKLEQKLIEKGKQHILIWKRFIDDVFIVWTGSKTQFIAYMNEIKNYTKPSNSPMKQVIRN